MSSFFNSFSTRSAAGNCTRLRVECLKHRVEFRDRQQNRSQSIGSTRENPVSVVSGLALVAPAASLSNAFRNSRLRFRLSSFFFRVRLNLALSPFLFDIYSPSRASCFGSDRSQSDAVASHLRGSAFPRFERFVYLFLGSDLCLPHHFRDLADQELSRLLQRLALAKRERPLLAQLSQ
jgi:hypothetical protein